MAKKNAAEIFAEAERRIQACREEAGPKVLDLSNLGLPLLPESLWRCTSLEELVLRDNPVGLLDPRISRLTSLRALDATRTQLPQLPQELGFLPALTSLAVGGNKLSQLPKSFQQHRTLRSLDLRRNLFETLPKGLPELPALRDLQLGGNPMPVLPQFFDQMLKLESLGIDALGLEAFPEELRKLVGLQRLYISRNPIGIIPDWIEEMVSLQQLSAGNCKLRALPVSMSRMPALENVEVAGNPISELPLELVSAPKLKNLHLVSDQLPADWQAQQNAGGWTALRDHMRKLWVARQKAKKELPVARTGKLVLVGHQENGKTCLQRALRGLLFVPNHPSTHGMNRVRLSLRTDGTLLPETTRRERRGPMENVIDFQLWDMGGQTHYQHTHQMFFTPGAIYLAVVKPRQGGQIEKLSEWLALIHKRTGGRARVIVVSTFCKQITDKAITLQNLQADFGPMVEDIVEVDSQDDTGIRELRARLAAMAVEDKDFQHHWLPGWPEAFDALARHDKPFANWNSVAAICKKHRIKDEEEQRQLVRTGHIIGTHLWREDSVAGASVIVLNPDWLNGAVARLLDDEQTKASNGLVPVSDLERIWTSEDREGNPGYPRNVHPLLIELLEANELAYRPKQDGIAWAPQEEERLLIVQMVQATPPADLTERWNALKPAHGREEMRVFTFRKMQGTGNGRVQDLIYLLIFRLRTLSLGRRNHLESVHWQRGLMVQDEYGGVGLIEIHGDELRVRVCSHLSERLLGTINHEIGQEQDAVMWPGLKKTESVVCGTACPRRTPEMGRIYLSECLEGKVEGNPKVRCQISDCGKWLNIEDLLHAPAPSSDMQRVIEKVTAFEEVMMQKVDTVIRQGENADKKLQSLLEDRELTRELINARIDEVILGLSDQASEGPRLFSARLKKRRFWEVGGWTTATYIITLWCEKSRMPVPYFQGGPGRTGEVEIEVNREWVAKSIPWLKSAVKLALAYKVLGGLGAGLTGIGSVASEENSGLMSQFTEQWDAELELLQHFDEGNVLDPAELAAAGQSGAGTSLRPFELEEWGQPWEKEDPFIPFVRDCYRQKDPAFAGLKRVLEPGLGWIWAHPKWADLA